VGGICVDQQDRVFVFNRGPHPMVVFDQAGGFLGSWGEGIFVRPHGVSLGPDGSVLCTDDGDHTVRKVTWDGQILLTLGIPGQPASRMSGQPFCRCTHTAMSPEGDIYVSDGYGNARIHKYSPAGELIFSWGEPGVDEGQFNIPHNIGCDNDGWVYVADRENHRVQIFDGTGVLHDVWHDIHRPSGLFLTPGVEQICYIGEAGPYHNANIRTPNLGPRVSLYTTGGKLIARLQDSPSVGLEPGQFLAPHGISVDSLGDIYVGEVSRQVWPRLFPGEPAPSRLRSLQKLVKVEAG
jgi:DNA-binding beta-propeller fold protein YncE